jgi:hypothetical protein
MAEQPDPPSKRPRGRPRKNPSGLPRSHWPRRWRKPRKNLIPAGTFGELREIELLPRR